MQNIPLFIGFQVASRHFLHQHYRSHRDINSTQVSARLKGLCWTARCRRPCRSWKVGSCFWDLPWWIDLLKGLNHAKYVWLFRFWFGKSLWEYLEVDLYDMNIRKYLEPSHRRIGLCTQWDNFALISIMARKLVFCEWKLCTNLAGNSGNKATAWMHLEVSQ